MPPAGHQTTDDAGDSAEPAAGGPAADPHRGGWWRMLERGQVRQHAACGDAVEITQAAAAAWCRQGRCTMR